MRRGSALLCVLLVAPAAPARGDSLYREETFQPLAADRKAFRVGDVLTVQVLESSTASTTTDTRTRRTNELAGVVGKVDDARQYGGTLSVHGAFDGGGATQRSNKLLATISVTVREVLPGGDLRVAGEQDLTVNQERHRVTVGGIVRPQDVSSDNVVVSTRLADAHIQYLGDGDLSDRQRRAWWRRLADWLGL